MQWNYRRGDKTILLRIGHCVHCGRCCMRCESYRDDEPHCSIYETRPISCKVFPVHPLKGYYKDFCGFRFLDSETLEENVLADVNCVVIDCESI